MKVLYLVLATLLFCSCDKKQGSSEERYLTGNTTEQQSPESFIKFYVKTWSEKPYGYKALYLLLSQTARESMSEDKFVKLMKERDSATGGPGHIENLKKLSGNDFSQEWTMKLVYKRETAKPDVIKTVIEKENNRYTVKSGGLIPLDLSDY